MSQVVYQTGAYPGFCSMKRLGVLLLSIIMACDSATAVKLYDGN